jgi:tRNA (guanine37-N1)-methyltransferase
VEIDVFTLFPDAFGWFGGQRHVANVLAAGHRLGYVNYRDHTPLKAGQVDDMPMGGGAGMVLRVDVVEAALRARYGVDPVELPAQRRVVALTPAGRLLDEALVEELSRAPALTLLCGRYEGFDQRVIDHFSSDQVSIGRYVLAGGELPAMVVCDAVMRKLPGALGHAESAVEESFSRALEGAPEYPHYTRPAEYRGWRVPEVLLSGHHGRIREWRLAQSRARAAGAQPGGEGSPPVGVQPGGEGSPPGGLEPRGEGSPPAAAQPGRAGPPPAGAERGGEGRESGPLP